jgi:hypothetical protein
MKLRCTFIEPLFAAALETMYRKGEVYEASGKVGSIIGAVHVKSEGEEELVATPRGEHYEILVSNGFPVVRFEHADAKNKRFRKRETNVNNYYHDPRRMRRLARQVLKRRWTNPAKFDQDTHDFFKHVARNFGK